MQQANSFISLEIERTGLSRIALRLFIFLFPNCTRKIMVVVSSNIVSSFVTFEEIKDF
jgi:hypothetical protein